MLIIIIITIIIFIVIIIIIIIIISIILINVTKPTIHLFIFRDEGFGMRNNTSQTRIGRKGGWKDR